MIFSQAGIKIVNDETGETYVDEERFGWTTTSGQLRKFTLSKVARKLITELTGIQMEPARILGESMDDEWDGRDSFTRCRNCGCECSDDELDEQGYCPACHDVCYTDRLSLTQWDRM
jgi:rubrerythrin